MAKSISNQKKIQGLVVGQRNISLFLIGLISIVIGFILMAQPPVNGFLSKTLAPIILVIAYLIIIPVAIFIKDKNTKK
jgi:uncharacterized membrane protein HdeD (DUF308 family)